MSTRILALVAAGFFALGLRGAPLHAQGAGTVCKDGSTSVASGRGACSGHGGVDTKATASAKKADAKAAKAESKVEKKTGAAADQVTCSDGTTSKAGRGACSGHGGVKGSVPAATAAPVPSLPAAVPSTSPARSRSQAKSEAPTAPKAATNPSSKRGEDNDPTGAIAQCKDGMYSHAANHRGACSRHGGVAKFLKP